jgi:hypothetical protein
MARGFIDLPRDCARHADSKGNDCPGTRFQFVAERPGTDGDDYCCVTCDVRVASDQDCLVLNRPRRRQP